MAKRTVGIRSGLVYAMFMSRFGGYMKDRRASRGGNRNIQRDILDELADEQEVIQEEFDDDDDFSIRLKAIEEIYGPLDDVDKPSSNVDEEFMAYLDSIDLANSD